MITNVFNLGRAAQTRFLPISQDLLEQMRVLLLLRRGINQTRVRRRVLRFEILDRLKIGRVGHDFGKLLQLLELVRLRLLLIRDSSAHNRSSVWPESKTYAPIKRSTTENLKPLALSGDALCYLAGA